MLVGIIGFGNIGIRLAEKLSGFAVERFVYDPFITKERIERAGGKAVDFPDLLKKSDIVSLNLGTYARRPFT